MIADDPFSRAEWVLLSVAVATLFVGVVLILARTALRRRPAARAATFQIASVLLLVVPLWAAFVARFELGMLAPESPLSFTFDASEGVLEPPLIGEWDRTQDERASPAVSTLPAAADDMRVVDPGRSELVAWTVWIGGLVLVLLPLAVSWMRVRSLRRSLRPCREEWETALVALGGSSTLPALRASDAVDGPVTLGVRRPVIVLPETMGDAPPAEGHVAVLAHELAHVRRSDALRAMLDRIVLAVYWFHPLVWLFVRAAAIAREDVCDNHALAHGSPRTFARTLLDLAETRAKGRRSAGVFVHAIAGWDLESRIAGLIDPRRESEPEAGRGWTAAVTGLGLAVSGVLVLACSPSNGASRDRGAGPTEVREEVSVELDSVLRDHGFDDLAFAEMEFVWDHGAGGPYVLGDGREIPPETTWRFDDPGELLRVLAQVPIRSFADDRWLEAKAEFIVSGKTTEGLHAQISFHSVRGRATISLIDPRGERKGGELRIGDVTPLLDLMRTQTPSSVKVPLAGAHRKGLAPDVAPTEATLQVIRDHAELERYYGDDAWKIAGPGKGHLVGLLFRAPATSPPRVLVHGGATLRNGTELAQLVFLRPPDDDFPYDGWGSELMVLVRVPDPSAIRSVTWVQPGRKDTEIRLD